MNNVVTKLAGTSEGTVWLGSLVLYVENRNEGGPVEKTC